MATDPLLGQMIGSYRVEAQIGQGGMGRIYLAVQPSIGARVAIKVLAEERARDLADIERFFAEARVVNVIRHENIVNVLDLRVLEDGSPCIVMEHLDGAPLSDVIATRGPLPAKEVGALAQEILAALAAAHEKGIIHRDLKPANIFVTKGGHAKILDFGIAKLLTRPAGSGPTLAGQIVGSPAYLAPEQVRGASDVDGRADLYALGVVLFEALTGSPPFAGETAFDLLRAHEHTAPRAPQEVSRAVPKAVGDVVLRALQKDRQLRFADAREMAHALAVAGDTSAVEEPIPDTVPADHAARNAMTMPPQVVPRPEGRRWIRSVPALVMVGAVTLTLVLAGAGLVFRGWLQNTSSSGMSDPQAETQPVPDAARFDASRFLADATALAEARMSDVALAEIDVTPADRQGLVDVTAGGPSAQVMYVFRGHKDGAPRAVFVVVTAGLVRTIEGSTSLPAVPFPRCTVREVLATADLPADRAQVTYARPTPELPTVWRVTATNGKGMREVRDECAGRR